MGIICEQMTNGDTEKIEKADKPLAKAGFEVVIIHKYFLIKIIKKRSLGKTSAMEFPHTLHNWNPSFFKFCMMMVSPILMIFL